MAYFEQDQPKTGGVLNDMRNIVAPSNVYIMLCSRTTPAQRCIIWERLELETEDYSDLLNYFITESHYISSTYLVKWNLVGRPFWWAKRGDGLSVVPPVCACQDKIASDSLK